MGVSVHQHDCRDNQSFIFIPSVTGADQYFAVTSVCNFTAVEASSDASLCGNPGCGRAMELVRIWDARRGVIYERALPARVIRIGAAVDPVSQTVKVMARFDGAEGLADVLAGMSGAAEFPAQEG